MEFLPILTGGLLVLLTWIGCAGAVVSVGLTPAVLVLRRTQGSREFDFGCVLRHSLWWGLLLIAIWAYALNLWQPLGSGVSLAATLFLVVLAGVVGFCCCIPSMLVTT